MNLKYYLKGLGLGIIVTALILGIHHKVTDKSMTDAEVKIRAQELGMVDSNSKLVSGDDNLSAQDLLDTIEETPETETENSAPDDETADTSEEKEPAAADDAEAEDASETEETEEEKEIMLENTRIDSVTDAEDDPDRKTEEPAEEPESVEEPAEEPEEIPADDTSAETSEEEPESEPEVVTGGVVLTINSGDSSDKVARKLADLGLVLNASEYDSFLCSSGYDRLIRVGTYTIPSGASNDEIAKIITGKK